MAVVILLVELALEDGEGLVGVVEEPPSIDRLVVLLSVAAKQLPSTVERVPAQGTPQVVEYPDEEQK